MIHVSLKEARGTPSAQPHATIRRRRDAKGFGEFEEAAFVRGPVGGLSDLAKETGMRMLDRLSSARRSPSAAVETVGLAPNLSDRTAGRDPGRQEIADQPPHEERRSANVEVALPHRQDCLDK